MAKTRRHRPDGSESRNERAAVAWAKQHLRGYHCPACGRQWVTGASVAQLWHACDAPAQPRPRRIPVIKTVEEWNAEQGEKWARALFGEALEDAVPEEDRLRRLE